jgi:protein-disulfide isomerase
MKSIFRIGLYTLCIIGFVGFMVYLGARQDYRAENGDIPAITSADWTKGDAGAPIRLVEYSDFQCPSCAMVDPLIKEALKGEESRVFFVYRHFPLSQIHANAQYAAQAAEAAGRQGKFWEVHDLLFEKQDEWGESENAQEMIKNYVITTGINMEQWAVDVNDQEIIKKIENDAQGALRAGVDGTPTFFMNGKAIGRTPTSVNAWKELFDSVAL